MYEPDLHYYYIYFYLIIFNRDEFYIMYEVH